MLQFYFIRSHTKKNLWGGWGSPPKKILIFNVFIKKTLKKTRTKKKLDGGWVRGQGRPYTPRNFFFPIFNVIKKWGGGWFSGKGRPYAPRKNFFFF